MSTPNSTWSRVDWRDLKHGDTIRFGLFDCVVVAQVHRPNPESRPTVDLGGTTLAVADSWINNDSLERRFPALPQKPGVYETARGELIRRLEDGTWTDHLAAGDAAELRDEWVAQQLPLTRYVTAAEKHEAEVAARQASLATHDRRRERLVAHADELMEIIRRRNAENAELVGQVDKLTAEMAQRAAEEEENRG